MRERERERTWREREREGGKVSVTRREEGRKTIGIDKNEEEDLITIINVVLQLKCLLQTHNPHNYNHT